MSDPISSCDPNEAYEVVSLDPIRKDRDAHGQLAYLCNGHEGKQSGVRPIYGYSSAARWCLRRHASEAGTKTP
jgi:hypothetical protein